MPRVETGLPQMNLDAPRLLAHCFLFELDDFLKVNGVDFARYMDDINAGVDSVPIAKQVLRDIDLILQTRQVRLNSGKTLILTQQDAERHFRAMENGELDILEAELEQKVKKKESIADETKALALQISNGLRGNEFIDGDKILKRLLGISIRYKIPLPPEDIRRIFRLWASCRESALRHLSVFPLNKERASLFADFARDPYLIDDASCIELSNNLVSTQAKSNQFQEELDRVFADLYAGGLYGFCSAIALASKYQTRQWLMSAIKLKRTVWTPSYFAGRQVGALAPLYYDTDQWEDYQGLILNGGNEGAFETFRFHEALRARKTTPPQAMDVVKKPNPSKGTRINHSKFLCLLSIFQNANVSKKQKQYLFDAHTGAWADYYYRRIGRQSAGLKELITAASKPKTVISI